MVFIVLALPPAAWLFSTMSIQQDLLYKPYLGVQSGIAPVAWRNPRGFSATTSTSPLPDM